MSRRKKIFLCCGAVLLVAMLSLVFWPEKPVNDADLQLKRVELPGAENAFFVLEEARGLLDVSESQQQSVTQWLSGTNWNSGEVSALLAKNQKPLALFDEAMRLPRLQGPELKAVTDLLPHLGPWKRLGQLATLRAETQAVTGNFKAAFDGAISVLHFGQQIENSDGCAITYLVGSAVKTLAATELRRIAMRPGVEISDLLGCIGQLAECPASEGALTNMFKTEYRAQVNAVRQMRKGTFPGGPSGSGQRVAFSLLSHPLLKERETQEIFARSARIGLQCIPLRFAAMPRNTPPMFASKSVAARLLEGNIMGQVLVSMLVPAQDKIMLRKCRENVEMAATQAVLALRCHQLKHGRLPDFLDELVPEFVPSVPMDDFDGKPLRYSPEKKLVYSVGEDLADSGGLEKKADGTRLDLVYKIEF